jgi:ribosomal protein L44E
VLPAPQTTRNHCPQCFFSLHVDGEIPGARDTDCGGVMLPIEYLIKHSKQKIKFQCITCGKQHINKVAIDDDI